MSELVGIAEIGELLGVSRQRVTQLAKRDDFPAPIARLRMGPVWTLKAVRGWNKQR